MTHGESLLFADCRRHGHTPRHPPLSKGGGGHHPSFIATCDPLAPDRRVLGLTTRGDTLPLPQKNIRMHMDNQMSSICSRLFVTRALVIYYGPTHTHEALLHTAEVSR